MKSVFLRNGNVFTPADPQSLDMHPTLPPAVYNVGLNIGGHFLSQMEPFSLPSKTYGDTARHADRIFSTFQARPAGTGVTLAGEKGSGKTLLSKILSSMALAQGMPTLVVNEPFHGDGFNRFIQGIEQPAMVLFDEFEKVYDGEQQASMLTLLDGTFASKKLFVLTCNDKWRVDAHMRNRPGRIFYSIDFRGLEEDFIRSYCQDHVKNKEHIEGVLRVASLFGQFNFDMLQALVEEMNRYGESASEASVLLNIQPEGESGALFTLSLTLNGVAVPMAADRDSEVDDHPLQIPPNYSAYLRVDAPQREELARHLDVDEDGDLQVSTGPHLFESAGAGRFNFEVRESPRVRLVFTRVRPSVARRVF